MWLTFILHLFIGATLAGVAVIAALVTGYDTIWTILACAVAGFLAALPVSWLVAKRLS